MTHETDDAGGGEAPAAPMVLQPIEPEPRGKPVPMRSGAVPMGIVPQTYEDCWRLAKMIFKSKLAPYTLKNEEAVCVVILKGMELGLPPMAAMSGIAVIGGKPCVYGDLVMAVIRKSGLLESFEESFEGQMFLDEERTKPNPDYTAICTMTRAGGGTMRSEYSIGDAMLAKLWGKMGGQQGDQPTPWITNPRRMLRFRARQFCSRDLFQDIIMGLDIAEELQDAVDAGTLREVAIDEAPAAPRIMSRAESREAGKGAIDQTFDWDRFERDFYKSMERADSTDEAGRVWAAFVGSLNAAANDMPPEMRRRLGQCHGDKLDALKAATEPERGDAPPAAPEPTKSEVAAAPAPGAKPVAQMTWGERLEFFRSRLQDEGHDNFVRDMLETELQSPGMPAKIKRDYQAAAEARIRELDGHRGPARAHEPTPDEEAAGDGPPAAPDAPPIAGEVVKDDAYWARHERLFRAQIQAVSNLKALGTVHRNMMEAVADLPVSVATRMQNAYDTVAFRFGEQAKPPVTEGKAAFGSTDAMEEACDEQATKLRKAKTLPELDAAFAELQSFFKENVVDRENTDKLENVAAQRRRLIESKSKEA